MTVYQFQGSQEETSEAKPYHIPRTAPMIRAPDFDGICHDTVW